jgi:hypothetical protein
LINGSMDALVRSPAWTSDEIAMKSKDALQGPFSRTLAKPSRTWP